MASTKRKIANKLLSRKERTMGISPFLSRNWQQRKLEIRERVKRMQTAARDRRIMRENNA